MNVQNTLLISNLGVSGMHLTAVIGAQDEVSDNIVTCIESDTGQVLGWIEWQFRATLCRKAVYAAVAIHPAEWVPGDLQVVAMVDAHDVRCTCGRYEIR